MRRHTFYSALALIFPAFSLAESPTEKLDFFEKRIRPVLVQKCYRCHATTSKRVRGGLLLDSREAMLKGGDNGPSLIPGKPKESLLLQALKYQKVEMPPSGKLSNRIIADFEKWILDGAHDPRSKSLTAKKPSTINIEKSRQFWAFQRPTKYALPLVKSHAWPTRRIDHFTLAKMEASNRSPMKPLARRSLIRRVTFDLTGLPPTPAEVKEFVADRSPSAFEKVVERLLASPHYGERWARLWLDVARYAEDQAHIVGSNKSLFYPNAYLYRDWVIGALNRDVPYDEFVQLQLAADVLKREKDLAALGFLGLGPKYYRRNSLEVMADEWEDRVDVVSRGLQGLTVACARCHDHKYDPIPTEDYYALAGVFASTDMFNRPLGEAKPKKRKKGGPTSSMHIVREGKPKDLNIFVRGNVKTRGRLVKRHFLQILCEGEPTPLQQGSGRLNLARSIASRDNPLTARVIVNRVWAALFGRGIVGTPSNFGTLGERPTHPKLLDDLAVRFMENGWSLKWLHRELTLSSTYQQSRGRSRRLTVEQWRDSILSATGELSSQVGGRSIDPEKASRRTVYARISRLELSPMLAMLDFPDPSVHSARRVETTTPLQKMFILNSPFMVQRAKQFALRLKEVKSDEERVAQAYRLLFSRPPSATELKIGLTFVRSRGGAWELYCHALLASNEAMFLD